MGIAKLATSIAETGVKQEVGITMLKKAQEAQAASAAALIAALPQPAANLPPHLGNHVNTTA
jgi:hypothetical protein